MTRVLVVDDVDMIVAALCWQLHALGYEVVTAPSPALLDPQHPAYEGTDALLCDLFMPDVDGVQVAAVTARHHPTMRRVCLTGLDLSSPRLAAARLIYDEILPKPCDINRIVKALS